MTQQLLRDLDAAIYGEFEAECTEAGCLGKMRFEQAKNCGYRLGELIPKSPAEPQIGRCPRCRGYRMRLVRKPADPPAAALVGFDRLPTT